MPDFAALAGLFGNIKGVFDFIAGTTGSLGKFDENMGNVETLFGSVSE